MALPLFEAFAGCEGRIGRLALGSWPTPVEPLPGLGRALGLGGFWLKCDGRSGERYGGNKVRKLEFVLADALDRGASGIRTFCTTGSHHGLATALYARPLGLDVELLQIPQPPSAHVSETIEAIARSGARLRPARSEAALALAAAQAAARDAASGERWRWVPAGGSSPLGALGYVSAGLELAAQVAAGVCPEPERIYVALSTGGTFAGLWAGCALAGLRSQVVGVRVADRALANEALVRALAAGALDRLRRAGAIGARQALSLLARPVCIVGDQLGAGYGHPTPAAVEALGLLRQHGGPELEPTYTGKALAALVAAARRGELAGRRVLFWNTFNLREVGGSLRAPR